mmetsp:Transcript_4116/g.7898  ORF Transcript_4116/g.7898 Transcript_4116/m.7898 type:complete len:157 (-) Transcript_4116:154-624(-)|eukprot:CAMPEP_0170199976 /NCGR_PEP_ID=MMETSP0040_2-20121228/69629_1 /TAXON_ID=641309 /ORGANISM="Lotharella oceanica, Strain CCMP622" /LENGTH=156 /DNA_ID=CAMNT_0010450137 /DNA_START=371 /DNA_END=841 /DNA_ORIENTATION=-
MVLKLEWLLLLVSLLCSSYALQNLPGEPELVDIVAQARANGSMEDDASGPCQDDHQLLASLSGKKKMTCDAALSMFQDQDASCHDDLGFGPLSKPCPVTCGICKASEEKRAVVIALHMIRAALAAMDEEEQSQVMAGLWADAEIKGMTPALNKEEL